MVFLKLAFDAQLEQLRMRQASATPTWAVSATEPLGYRCGQQLSRLRRDILGTRVPWPGDVQSAVGIVDVYEWYTQCAL